MIAPLFAALFLQAASGAAGPACDPPAERSALVLWMDVLEARPGETLALAPKWTAGPSVFRPVAPACVGEVSVSDAKLASVSPDRKSLTLASDAPDGALFDVTAKVGGRTVAGKVRVFRAEAHPLTGRWSEQRLTCGGAGPAGSHTPMRELEFRADGRFSATWRPFETYRDYWGTYAYDPASGRLKLTAEDGNNIPADLKPEGVARLTPDGALELTGLRLGQPHLPSPPAECVMRFLRLG